MRHKLMQIGEQKQFTSTLDPKSLTDWRIHLFSVNGDELTASKAHYIEPYQDHILHYRPSSTLCGAVESKN